MSIGGRRVRSLRFADDIDLINKSEEEANTMANKLNRASQKYGMEINLEKTKVMTSGGARAMNVQMEGEHLEQVTEFTYLGATTTEKAKSDREVKIQNRKGNSSPIRAQDHMEEEELEEKDENNTHEVTSDFYFPLFMRDLDPECRVGETHTSFRKQLLQKTAASALHDPYHQHRNTPEN